MNAPRRDESGRFTSEHETPPWYCTEWETAGGRKISIGKGWDHQIIDLKLTNGTESRSVKVTPHQMSDLLSRHADRHKEYGVGWTGIHAIDDFLKGGWKLDAADMRFIERNHSHAKSTTPLVFPGSKTFGAGGLMGGAEQTGEGMPRIDSALPHEVYERLSKRKDAQPKAPRWYENIGGESALGRWINLRIRRFRQRLLLGGLARRMRAAGLMRSKLPW